MVLTSCRVLFVPLVAFVAVWSSVPLSAGNVCGEGVLAMPLVSQSVRVSCVVSGLCMFPNECVVVGRIISESKRLDKEEESAEELLASRRAALRQAQADLDESLNRLERLRKQKRQLISKGNEMARLGLQSLDELEEEERRESDAVIEAQSLGAIDLIDWNAVSGDANFGVDEMLSVEGSSL